MKKQIRKAMLCTVCMMLMGVVSLTGVTYAWFSRSDEADVNGLTMEVVQTDGGVYISTQPYSDFGTAISITPPEGTVYNPASTAGELNADGQLKFFSGTLDSPSDPTVKITEISSPEEYYIRQDVYFDNSTGSTDIQISLAGTEIAPTRDANKPTHLATRVAIVTHGSITLEQFTAGADYPTTTDNSKVVIYENNSAKHTQQGKNEYLKIDSEAGSETTYKYFALKDVTSGDENSAGGVTRFTASSGKLQDMSLSGKVKTSASDVIITVPAGSYLKTTVYVWLEGQDADCQNNISGNTYTAAIKFTKVGTAPAN